jgi:hypothetical protein
MGPMTAEAPLKQTRSFHSSRPRMQPSNEVADSSLLRRIDDARVWLASSGKSQEIVILGDGEAPLQQGEGQMLLIAGTSHAGLGHSQDVDPLE